MKALRLILSAYVCFSVATLLAEGGVAVVLWAKGAFTQQRLVNLLAVAYGIDLGALRRRLEERTRPVNVENQLSYEDVLAARTAEHLDLDLRETALEKGLAHVRYLAALLEQEKSRYGQLKSRFDKRLESLRQGAADTAVKDVQRQLESLSPKLAKGQIIRLLDDKTLSPDVSMNFVVTIVKAMSVDERKKILAEFKSDEEAARLHEILTRIRRGIPDVELIRQTRAALNQLEGRR